MIQKLCSLIFRLWGWTATNVPDDKVLRKKIYVAVPHTSNWDFPVGILLKGTFNLDVQWVGKSSLFKAPYGWLFRKLAGIPVDRSKKNNFVDAVVQVINETDQISICVAPEGTRKKVEKIKSGFYWMAVNAKVPLVLTAFNWQDRVVNFSDPFYPSGDYEADLPKMMSYFEGKLGRIPENGINYK